ncbi:MAG: adenylosuccinate synthetase [Microcella sp.]|uniref:adenylosuccinate synthetase n=1 Tax=Microcella sp. TaxID=1913979 RepID=UPI0024CAA959|nr:adenylosuccinate synthetase [Microcella sp.]UYN84743.1 MAG: adenylosuccinate synthetase [Microcella sp.]
MPVSIIVGAQYGSEGKGKVAFAWARNTGARVAVRVGGPNSGHTVVQGGVPTVLRQLPTPSLLEGRLSILTPGSYINVDVLLNEIGLVGANPSNLVIDPRAVIVTQDHIATERSQHLGERIGSTCSGVGAAVAERVRRQGKTLRARDTPALQPFLGDTLPLLRGLANRERVVVEGTQGFGLSLLHGLEGDYATSRDTTAAGFLSEVGLSPLDVDEVVLVARAFPIRVAGNSGTLSHEIDWSDVGARAGREVTAERTTVTNRVRRVGEFDSSLVKRAIDANRPSHIVLNHLDYVADMQSVDGIAAARAFLSNAEREIGQTIDYVGIDRESLETRSSILSR